MKLKTSLFLQGYFLYIKENNVYLPENIKLRKGTTIKYQFNVDKFESQRRRYRNLAEVKQLSTKRYS